MDTDLTKRRNYGQYCGLVRALELIGERWALLIVRDLLVGPRRFSDLKSGFARIPSNILSARLQELEQAGVVERRVLPRPSHAVVYELTAFGTQLESIVLALGRWGAQVLGEPRAEESVTQDSLIMALRSTFRPEAARGLTVSYELRMGDIVLHAHVRGSKLEVGAGSLPKPDLIIDAGHALRPLMAGEISPTQARASGAVRLIGPSKLLTRFVEVFRIDQGGPPRNAPSDPPRSEL